MADESVHRWFHSKLDQRRVGLLEDDEERRYEAHLSECEECRALHAINDGLFPADEPPAGSHLPAALLARWPRTRRMIRGPERVLAQRHLEECRDCRQELVMLGYEPTLGDALELEPALSIKRRWRRRWIPWVLTGWAGCATAAALLLSLRAASPRRDLELAPVLYLSSTRGDTENIVHLEAGVDRVLLCLPPLPQFLADETLEVRLVAPDGRVILERPVTATSIAGERGLLVPLSLLRAGAYRLEVRSTLPESTSDPVSFDVQISTQ